MLHRFFAKAVVFAAFACACVPAFAFSSNWDLEYNRLSRPSDTIGTLGPSLFGDQVDLYNGQASFEVTDISIPGNSKLPVALTRRLDVAEPQGGGSAAGFGNWEIEVPYLSGYFSEAGWSARTDSGEGTVNRCSVPDVAHAMPPNIVRTLPTSEYATLYGYQYWSGNLMHVPGAGTQELLVVNTDSPRPSQGGPYYWVTKNDWAFSCLPSLVSDTTGEGGEGFLATSPDGTKYYFDVMRRAGNNESYASYTGCVPERGCQGGYATFSHYGYFLLASHVVDRFGNWVAYHYNGNQLASIKASDGREIDLTYNASGMVHTALAVSPSNPADTSRTWTYSYTTIFDGPALAGVVQPDGSTWGYQYAGSLLLHKDPDPPDTSGDPHLATRPDCTNPDPIPLGLKLLGPPYGAFSVTATHPSGEQGTFQFLPLIRGLSNAISCAGKDPLYPKVRKQWAVMSKVLTDPTLQASNTWTYTYSPPNDSFEGATCSAVPCYVWTDVAAPDGTHVRTTFGNAFEITEGQLQEVETYTLDANKNHVVLDDATTTYVDTNTAFPQFIGDAPQPRANVFLTEEQHPVLGHVRTRQGVTFASQVATYSHYANPSRTTRSSSLGYSRTDTLFYWDDAANWVLQQPTRLVNNDSGAIVYDKPYDGRGLPTSVSSFGRLEYSYGFLADGNLNTVTEGSTSQTTTLSNYKRGVPRTLQFADGTSKTAVVDDFGHVTTLTDENRFATGFTYDAMGRLASIVQPAGDTQADGSAIAWKPTTITFAQSGTAEYGLQPGHWTQTEATGTARKVTYFDGYWQPVVTREYDAANPAGTSRFTTKAYDFDGRATFASYPVGALTAWNDPLAGVQTWFDGLGRPKKSTQDSELGGLDTLYTYLPQFVTQVKNPRGYSTTTAYQVFDEPSTDSPVAIASPETVSTTIARDVFGKPTAITRSGTWAGAPVSETRSYVYDANQRLCKRIEPETGASILAYDGANNIAWSLAGSAQTSTASCNNGAVPANAIVHGYDLRNRPQTQTVPGSTPVAWTYYPDGALKTLTSGSGGAANVWTYAYDKRRLPTTEQLAIDGRTKTIAHTYDVYGHESALTYPSGLVLSAAPNALGQPSRAGSFATGASYFPNGGMSGFAYGNGIVHALTQNVRELPLRSLDQAPGSPAVLDDSYAYDENANVAAIADGTSGNGGNRTMAYDGLDRLTQVNAPNQWWIAATTTYDPLDNIRTNQVGNTTAYRNTFAYDPATWRLSGVSGHATMTPGYDANGNVTGKGNGNDAYVFDLANRMLSVTGKESYTYDGYGRRVKVVRTNDGKTDYPVYTMGGQLLTDDDQRANTTTDYVSLNGSLVAKRTAPLGTTAYATSYEHTDALHSPTVETNAAGLATRVQRYTPYGEPGDNHYVQGPGFTGHVTDAATGLTYAQQRYYDPVLVHFLSVDPVAVETTAAANFCRYCYGKNNPYKFTDPDGRQVVIEGPSSWTPIVAPPSGGIYVGGSDDSSSFGRDRGRGLRPDRPTRDADIRPDRPAGRVDRDGIPIPDAPGKGSNIQTARTRDPNFRGEVWANNKAKNGGNAACDTCTKPVQPGQKLGRGDTVPHDRGEADHVNRLASGGADDASSNGQLLCHECHVDKTANENRK